MNPWIDPDQITCNQCRHQINQNGRLTFCSTWCRDNSLSKIWKPSKINSQEQILINLIQKLDGLRAKL